MGNGVGIKPLDNKVYAPFDGTIEFIAETKHAIGLISEDGLEILIHVGMDTVKMNGEGFNIIKQKDSKVKQGELLLEFDIDKINNSGYSTITPVVVTNTDNYDLEINPSNESTIQQDIIIVAKNK